MILVTNALDIAKKVHENQFRDDEEPYINHCIRVARLLNSHFGHYATNELTAVALLHDTLEDCGEENFASVYESIYTMCSPQIAAKVDLLTKKSNPRHFSKKRYLSTLSCSPKDVVVVKIADRIDNLNSIPFAGWDLKRILSYVEDSVAIYDIACSKGLGAEAQQLKTTIMLLESTICSMGFK